VGGAVLVQHRDLLPHRIVRELLLVGRRRAGRAGGPAGGYWTVASRSLLVRVLPPVAAATP